MTVGFVAKLSVLLSMQHILIDKYSLEDQVRIYAIWILYKWNVGENHTYTEKYLGVVYGVNSQKTIGSEVNVWKVDLSTWGLFKKYHWT